MEEIGASPLEKSMFLLDPSVIFLNHGSFGATPRLVFEKYQWWQRELERQPVEFLSRRFASLMEEARTSLAGFVQTASDNLVFVPNATTGLNIVARSLHLQPGDEILATNHEYGALDRTWRFVCRKTGAVYKQQPIPVPVTTAENFIEQFCSGITPRTRIIFLSHITSPTALIFPVREICRRAREAGILTVIDGAHAIGQVDLNLEELGADWYVSNLHKWLNAPKGSAFLYARPDLQHITEPLIVSWGYESDRPSESRFIDEQEWTGTRDIAAYLTTPEAIRFFQERIGEERQGRCHALAQYARMKITELTRLPPISPDSSDWYAQMVSLPLPPCNAEVLKQRLYEEFRIEVPIVLWQNRPYIRISLQVYNNQEQVGILMQALEKLLGS